MQEPVKAFDVSMAGPEFGAAGVRGDSDFEVGERQCLAVVAQFRGQQSDALPGGAVQVRPGQSGKRGEQFSAIAWARAGDQLGHASSEAMETE